MKRKRNYFLAKELNFSFFKLFFFFYFLLQTICNFDIFNSYFFLFFFFLIVCKKTSQLLTAGIS